jgi:hypothetical protein
MKNFLIQLIPEIQAPQNLNEMAQGLTIAITDIGRQPFIPARAGLA